MGSKIWIDENGPAGKALLRRKGWRSIVIVKMVINFDTTETSQHFILSTQTLKTQEAHNKHCIDQLLCTNVQEICRN